MGEVMGNSYTVQGFFLQLIVVRVVQLCEYSKSQATVHFKWMNYMACGLFTEKAVKKKKKE